MDLAERRSSSFSASAWSAEVWMGLMSMALFPDGRGVDRVILGMRADEADVDDEELVLDGDDDEVLVALILKKRLQLVRAAGCLSSSTLASRRSPG